jgi:hypothetical protein
MIERAYCLICRKEIMTESGQVCPQCAEGGNQARRRGCAAVLAILLASLTLGCATIPAEKHVIHRLTIVCEDYHALNARHAERVGGGTQAIGGFYDIMTGTVYVPWTGKRDMNGDPLPDFQSLGHEVWHAVRPSFHQ